MTDNNNSDRVICVGSRKSQLALLQTNKVVAMLQKENPTTKFKVITMDTMGDLVLDTALSKIGEKSLFTKELEVALHNKQVDFLVHSLKDLPTTLPEGMDVGAYCARDNAYDCVLMNPKNHAEKITLADLPAGSVVGTSSLRRIAQLKRAYPALKFEDIRGNLNTRLRKLDSPEPSTTSTPTPVYDAIILARAGIDRMGWETRVSQMLTAENCLFAVGQGAMAVECRQDDAFIKNLLDPINCKVTALVCRAERSLMRSLEGGCSAPLGVDSTYDEEKSVLSLTGGVFSLDGSKYVIETITGEVKNAAAAEEIGVRLAQLMSENGAQPILQAAHDATHASNPSQHPTKA
eukprot:CFRG5274T1